MDEFVFDQKAYLNRIGFDGVVSIDFETLKALHRAHHTTIPFENFDICLGKNIHLEPKVLFEKLVVKNRGGYCFEVNGLFLMALESFGFNARALLGRVHYTGEPTGKGHQVSLVTIGDKQWILDMGFGSNTPQSPIPFVYNEITSFQDKKYRIIKNDLYTNMLQGIVEGEWKDFYSFELTHVCQGDITYGNHYTSTHPSSFFLSTRIAVMPIKNGVKALLDFNLKKTINGVEENTIIEDGPAYLEVLKQEFGIVLDAEYEDLKVIEPKEDEE